MRCAYYGVPSKGAPQRKTPTVSGKSRVLWGCPPIARFCFVSSKQNLRADYLLAQAKPRFCVSATQFANTFAYGKKVNLRP